MTIADLKSMTRETITPQIAAQVIGCDPHYIRLQARVNPALLGFPVMVYKSRTKIPRLAFIRWLEGGGGESEGKEEHHAETESHQDQPVEAGA